MVWSARFSARLSIQPWLLIWHQALNLALGFGPTVSSLSIDTKTAADYCVCYSANRAGNALCQQP